MGYNNDDHPGTWMFQEVRIKGEDEWVITYNPKYPKYWKYPIYK